MEDDKKIAIERNQKRFHRVKKIKKESSLLRIDNFLDF